MSRPIPQHVHGVNGYVNYKCRCSDCVAARSLAAMGDARPLHLVWLDAPTRGGARHDLIPDPSPQEAFHQIESKIDPREIARLLPICPPKLEEFLRDGNARIVWDEAGPRIVTPRFSDNDAVPWQDFAGPIPSMAITSAGKMAHRSHPKKQAQKVGWSRGHGSRKSKVAA